VTKSFPGHINIQKTGFLSLSFVLIVSLNCIIKIIYEKEKARRNELFLFYELLKLLRNFRNRRCVRYSPSSVQKDSSQR
jgi:hypothetical protein